MTQPETNQPDSEDDAGPSTSIKRHVSSSSRPEPKSEPERTASLAPTPAAEDVEMSMEPEGSMTGGQGGMSGTGATGGSFNGDSSSIRRRGTYMKDGPTVYKLVKPVLRAIRDARSRE